MNFFDKLEEFLKKDFSDSLNRSVYASGAVAPSGYGFARSFRCASFPRKTSATFCPPRNAAHCFIAAAKTSYTAGTLGEINPNFF
jgi:hypothetical protein